MDCGIGVPVRMYAAVELRQQLLQGLEAQAARVLEAGRFIDHQHVGLGAERCQNVDASASHADVLGVDQVHVGGLAHRGQCAAPACRG